MEGTTRESCASRAKRSLERSDFGDMEDNWRNDNRYEVWASKDQYKAHIKCDRPTDAVAIAVFGHDRDVVLDHVETIRTKFDQL